MRDELQIVESIRKKAKPSRTSGIELGIGDDCAIFHSKTREDLLFTADLLIEEVHFQRQTHSASDIGHKALARSLSDIAAMGGEPRFCLLSLALAPWADEMWLAGFLRGFHQLAKRNHTQLAGGDLAHAAQFACDVMVCGAIPRGKGLRRDGAKSGDQIYVSGQLGVSALGLELRKGPAWLRHRRPVPRLELGQFLREQARATSAIDLSDGLSVDLHRLCLESHVAASLDSTLPIFPGATIEQALHGGEDYELLFTVPPDTHPADHFKRVPLTKIGTIEPGRPGRIKFGGRMLKPQGYDHFRK